ncbi:dienelactone hydrolase family protein [Agriterribacter humi]|jgi:dienelactone hydrolase|uniref:dienelactone hydrolase family protein n=1 Tax=Agriterribacter humi TaxID=1104781 RepID=UPI001264B640|nr:dienelactone hydrolase family protein [Agriterribacter humi]
MYRTFHEEVRIQVDKTILEGDLIIPPGAHAIVVFSHGSGSSRFSKRNQQVATYLRDMNFGTLLLDLLTPAEDNQYHNRFNIELLAKRLAGATEWLERLPVAKDCRIGYFGASTGAASALQAAPALKQVGAIVSRGGRPDLASMDALKSLKAPVLLIVGSLDTEVLQLNRQAFQKLQCYKELVIVDGASHLFEEQGKLDEVAVLASAWFKKYLKPVPVIK